MSKSAFAFAGLLGILAGGASAADLASAPEYIPVLNSDFYLGSVSGLNMLKPTGFSVAGATVRSEYEGDSYQALRAGWGFGRTLGIILPRFDIEAGYARNSVDTHAVNGVDVGRIDSFGEARSFQGFANGYVDIDLGMALRPYVGGGVGIADVRLRRQGVSATGTLVDGSDTVFAYHLDAGISLDLKRLPFLGNSTFLNGTTLEVGYRFTEAADLKFVARDGTRSGTDYRSDMITFGTRKAF